MVTILCLIAVVLVCAGSTYLSKRAPTGRMNRQLTMSEILERHIHPVEEYRIEGVEEAERRLRRNARQRERRAQRKAEAEARKRPPTPLPPEVLPPQPSRIDRLLEDEDDDA